LSQLAGEPKTPGRFEFDIVAAAPSGACLICNRRAN